MLKKYTDAPESKSFNNVNLSMKNNEISSYIGSNINNNLNNDEDQGKDFVFNDFTAGAYQEFEVIKYNKYNNEQERILGIDRYHIYNDLPKVKEKSFLNFFASTTKTPLRKTENILKCEYLSNYMFFIDLDMENKTKKLIFKVKNNNIRNEIVSKIRHIMKMNQNS